MLSALLLSAVLASPALAGQTVKGIDVHFLLGLPAAGAPPGTPIIYDNSTTPYNVSDPRVERRNLLERARLTCPAGFALNDDKSACICRPGKFLSPDGSQCVSRCVTGWFDFGNGSCATCPDPFFACSDAVTPTRCSTGTFFFEKTCVTECPAGTWGDAAPGKNICRRCADKDAQTCSDGGASSATSCMSKYLSGGKCIDADYVPDGYYADAPTKTVERCDPNVSTCTCSGRGCATSCGKTKKGDQYLLRPDGTCSMRCPGGTYGNKQGGVCVACDSTALTCTAAGATSCAKDSAGTQLYLTPTKKCILSWTGPTGYYPDDATNTFKPCLDGVTSCVGPATTDALSCGKRTDDVALFFVPNRAESTGPGRQKFVVPTKRRLPESITGTCVIAEECPAAQWANPVDNTCTPCDAGESSCSKNGEGSALTCDSGLYLSEKKDCISADECTASGPFFADDLTEACSSCDPGEAACSGNGVGLATACATGPDGKQLYLYQGDCVSSESCPAAFYADQDKKQCLACDAGATSCKGPHQATACGFTSASKRLYLNIVGMCVEKTSCAATTWADPATQVCESCTLLDPDAATCTSPTVLSCSTKYFYQAACIDPCPLRFYANDEDHVCTPCDDPDALTCDAQGALSCESGYLWNRQCLPTCPSATYAVGHVCKACSDDFGVGTAVCTSQNAVTCAPGYDLYGRNCISDAECFALGAYFPSNGICSSCSSKYAYAATCNSERVLSCTNGRWIDNNGKCAPNCVWEAYWLRKEGNTDWWRRAEYLDDSGFASQCQLCKEGGALTCDRYTGKTTAWYVLGL
ncbi:hypothetical protein JCM10908_006477 [Rhodotorula pacifica]|uniref:uncharacterized protein n=1 Tax=Rhodotorula pacifica TaxID=1495444 RepID=UPI003171EE75